ncbi:MAG: hypothetical protein A2X05_18080 [Bacteroidetes bacterium GWE2_41_25]|nr:MAG: hypothetical protein A2X03_08515 [Bacteroidetes bacterium GWA2_40_15]OFX98337.1 MAG: hypothetical protein A2X05_18080 [Bacteroidetes bacterium GWE2_41_25]OFY00700.1 MAG: hypothetical protein A2X06_05280 [Bacteroidetes bacterium GWC2_40_22]OFY59268.1 MAG: hypothetical protein A2X04_04765 [Bacteroidetes bacterium GWF2_41_9]HAM10802.1 hypothetical protein [Bacteroidales bacterium]
MRKLRLLVILFFALAAVMACIKIEQLPAIPSIEFTSFEIFDTLDILGNTSKAGRLLFRFEDGDGDLGLTAPSGSQTDTTNMNLILFRKIDGTMVRVTDKNDPLLPYDSYRIPFMERLGQNQILRGSISVTFIYQSYSRDDTIKYDFLIKDRAENFSNLAETPEIIVSENNIYSK